MPDAKEWEKVATNIVKTRDWLFHLLDNETICFHHKEKISNIRFLLMIALENIDSLAVRDDEGWL